MRPAKARTKGAATVPKQIPGNCQFADRRALSFASSAAPVSTDTHTMTPAAVRSTAGAAPVFCGARVMACLSVFLPRSALIDFGDLHHDWCVVMGRVLGERTATYHHHLAYQLVKRGLQFRLGGEDVDRARALDGVVGIIGIETSRGGKSQDVGSLGTPGGILRSHDSELPGRALPFDIIFQAFGRRR